MYIEVATSVIRVVRMDHRLFSPSAADCRRCPGISASINSGRVNVIVQYVQASIALAAMMANENLITQSNAQLESEGVEVNDYGPTTYQRNTFDVGVYDLTPAGTQAIEDLIGSNNVSISSEAARPPLLVRLPMAHRGGVRI